MMAEYIEREALIAEFKRLALGEYSLIERVFADGVYTVLETFPAVDVAPVIYAKWGRCFGGDQCSACGFQHYGTSISHYHYCPNCGAKMQQEDCDNE